MARCTLRGPRGVLSVAEFLLLASSCAPSVPAATLLAIARTESALHPWALSINRPRERARRRGIAGEVRLARQPTSRAEALAWARELTEAGLSVSVGLMQINAEQLRDRSLLAEALEPCTNLHFGARVLTEHHDAARRAARGAPRGEAQLFEEALSRYNSGHPTRGISNGYVARVRAKASRD